MINYYLKMILFLIIITPAFKGFIYRKVYNMFNNESPMSRGTQKEMNKEWVIHPWRPRDMAVQLTYTCNINYTFFR
jgi:hypothetical protein